MSKRERYKEWLQERGLMVGIAAEHFGREGWKACADLAAERERQLEEQVDYLRSANLELVEALRSSTELLSIWRGWLPEYCSARKDFNALPEVREAHKLIAAYDERENGHD